MRFGGGRLHTPRSERNDLYFTLKTMRNNGNNILKLLFIREASPFPTFATIALVFCLF
jgi:hypothetical protein